MSERDIKRDREMCEKATKGPWTFSRDHGCKDIKGDKQNDTPQAHYMTTVAVTPGNSPDEQDRANARFIAESRTALPCYLNLCEHQQRMLEAASDLVWRVLRCCPPVSPKTCRRNARDCEKCIRDYLDQKAKEGEGK